MGLTTMAGDMGITAWSVKGGFAGRVLVSGLSQANLLSHVRCLWPYGAGCS